MTEDGRLLDAGKEIFPEKGEWLAGYLRSQDENNECLWIRKIRYKRIGGVLH